MESRLLTIERETALQRLQRGEQQQQQRHEQRQDHLKQVHEVYHQCWFLPIRPPPTAAHELVRVVRSSPNMASATKAAASAGCASFCRRQIAVGQVAVAILQ